jgi:hypothetical protein
MGEMTAVTSGTWYPLVEREASSSASLNPDLGRSRIYRQGFLGMVGSSGLAAASHGGNLGGGLAGIPNIIVGFFECMSG